MGFAFLVAGALLVVATMKAPARVGTARGLALLALVAVGEAGALVWFVSSDDPNVAGSRPRWDFNQDGATHPLFWLAIGLDAATVALAGLAVAAHVRLSAYAAAVSAAAGLIAGGLAVYGFSLT